MLMPSRAIIKRKSARCIIRYKSANYEFRMIAKNGTEAATVSCALHWSMSIAPLVGRSAALNFTDAQFKPR